MEKKELFFIKAVRKQLPPSLLEKWSTISKTIGIQSIKKKIILLFVILTIIPLVVMRFVVYPKAQRALQETLIQNLESVGHKQAELIKGWLGERKGDARVIAENPFTLLATRITMKDERFWRLLSYAEYIKYEYGYKEILISDAEGNVRISTTKGKESRNISGTEYFKKAMDGITFISQIVPSTFPVENEFGQLEEGLPTMIVSTPIADRNRIMGVACLRVDVKKISDLMRSIKLGESGETYLINKQGFMVSESRFISHLKKEGLVTKRTSLVTKLINPETGKFTKSVAECLKGYEGYDGDGYVDYRGIKVIGFWSWIPELDWGVIAEIDFEEGYEAIRRLNRDVTTIMVILAMGMMVLAVFLGQKMTAPILYLTEATRKMASGDLTQSVNIHSKDEIGELANSFNIMTSTITKRNEELQSTSKFMESIFNAIKDTMTVLDKDGNILQVNNVAMDIYGKDIVGKKCFCVYKGRDTICDDCPTMKAIETLSPASSEHYIARDKKHVSIASYPILDSGGKLKSVIKIVRDISEQKKLEQELQSYTTNLEKTIEERTRDLKQSNKELEQRHLEIEKVNEELRGLDKMKDTMIRDVSHELKSPVAQVKMAIDLWNLEVNKENVDKAKERRLNQIINDNIQRLQKTIQSILALSVLEAGRAKYEKEKLNIVELIHKTADGLKLIAEKKNLSLVLKVPDRLPEIMGDRQEITRVVSNLIDNAIKYSESGGIVVSASRNLKVLELSVKDTGIGLSLPKEEYHKLFDRFYQEKARSDGSGVGLAICKKIIEAHGGDMWVESEGKGSGSTFKFSLPFINTEDNELKKS
ncbi:MAG: HAMP domain-containing protein [Planctomycetes bacterium]|nr:HAMP domain-containing protein [Planctomycetota bacterium]